MKHQPVKKQHKQKVLLQSKSNTRWWVMGGVGAVIVVFIYWQSKEVTQGTSNSISTTDSAPVQADQSLLIGRWARTDSDGAYVIEIKSAGADGKLDASYFNPNPIKVGHASWQQKNKGIMIVVELRDVNYPGSTYTLQFSTTEDRMTGNYYQAVEGANFTVEFLRAQERLE